MKKECKNGLMKNHIDHIEGMDNSRTTKRVCKGECIGSRPGARDRKKFIPSVNSRENGA